ncbi:winged helix-turn-helix domain-containing protein [Patescibacteria group bacterium]|nr:winged helix-turn-helix domain-containing protein [Patescibacteria group bacterium]
MSEVFLMSADGQNKLLRFIQKKLINDGLKCQILDSPKNAIHKVKECFNLGYRNIPKLVPLQVADFDLNPEEYTLTPRKTDAASVNANIAGEIVKLRKKEYELLQFLITNKNRIINRNTILENVWGPDSNPFTNTVDVHIASLRKKLNQGDQVLLKTVHGVGYKLEL